MAVNLSGKADATLVAAAKGAAMANVPVDISKIHERVSKSYAAMTKRLGKSWGKVLKAVGQIGVKLATKGTTTGDDETGHENQLNNE